MPATHVVLLKRTLTLDLREETVINDERYGKFEGSIAKIKVFREDFLLEAFAKQRYFCHLEKIGLN